MHDFNGKGVNTKFGNRFRVFGAAGEKLSIDAIQK